MRGASRLEPFSPHANATRHSMQLLQSVCDHVTHEHAPKWVSRIVHVDGHRFPASILNKNQNALGPRICRPAHLVANHIMTYRFG